MKKDNTIKKTKNRLYPNGSKVKSFSISTENWNFIEENKEYSYSFTVNKMLDKLRLEKEK
jgi:hypothetical protein